MKSYPLTFDFDQLSSNWLTFAWSVGSIKIVFSLVFKGTFLFFQQLWKTFNYFIWIQCKLIKWFFEAVFLTKSKKIWFCLPISSFLYIFLGALFLSTSVFLNQQLFLFPSFIKSFNFQFSVLLVQIFGVFLLEFLIIRGNLNLWCFSVTCFIGKRLSKVILVRNLDTMSVATSPMLWRSSEDQNADWKETDKHNEHQ